VEKDCSCGRGPPLATAVGGRDAAGGEVSRDFRKRSSACVLEPDPIRDVPREHCWLPGRPTARSASLCRFEMLPNEPLKLRDGNVALAIGTLEGGSQIVDILSQAFDDDLCRLI